MITMKKITLGAILVFILVFIITFIGSNIINTKQLVNTQSTAPVINLGVPINTTENNSNKITNHLNKQINSPNIDVATLISNLNKQKKGTFSMDEVSKHNSRNDCYLIINNNVYDVSSYISYHPGGSSIITSRCGTKVTGIFANIHSNRAWDLLKKYKIGMVASTQTPVPESEVLTAISNALKEANPDAEIVNVKPKKGFYIAKIIYNKKLYEVHINSNGKIIKEETEDDETNWSLWESDNDDK